MPTRNVYHVVPSDDRWGVRLAGSPTLSYEVDDRDDALERAVGYVRQLGSGRIVVHGETGQIETVHNYDSLPSSPSRSPEWAETLLSTPVLIGVGAAALIAFGYGLSRRG
ncbi:DUF2188 domain-containing protein [Rubrivirga sp.]|uniref:DUF2188 domain-containing protein n=1 Tax=Rubrivirga sp. TaxID=1885344 RepID=UPI003C74E79D